MRKFEPSPEDLATIKKLVFSGETNQVVADHFGISTRTIAKFCRPFKDELRRKKDELIKKGFKNCTVCLKTKKLTDFYKNNKNRDGYDFYCEKCRIDYSKTRYTPSPRKPMFKNDQERKEHFKEYFRKYQKERAENDMQFKLNKRIRYRIWSAFNAQDAEKLNTSLEYLGCSPEEFKKYIESLWKDWMNWDNYGVYSEDRKTWQIDHIIPTNTFDLTDHDQACQAFHYSNCRPLCSEKNLRRPKDGSDIS